MQMDFMGYDPKTGFHRMTLTGPESTFLGVFWDLGAGVRISADALAVAWGGVQMGLELWGEDFDGQAAWMREHQRNLLEAIKRDIRELQNHILTVHDLPVYSKAGPGGGYWLSDDPADADDFYKSFRARGLTGLKKASRGKKSMLVDIVTQATFDFDADLVDRSGGEFRPGGPGQEMASIEMVDTFLERMTADPARYSDGLRRIGEKFGSVLLPKSRLAALREKTEALQRELEGL